MLTTKDWIERARDADDPAAPLEQAERAATWPDDWIQVGAAWAERGQAEPARRCIAAGVDHAAGEHWPCRRAAELLSTALGDPDGARTILDGVEARLRAPDRERPARAYEWVLLGRAYRDVLADAGAVTRCLAGGLAMAEAAADLADLADGLVELAGDQAGARALLERAEAAARAGEEPRQWWGIAIRWRESLGDEPRARTLLADATLAATDTQALAALAIAWHSLLHDEPGLRAALQRGEALASSAADWLVLAEGYRDGGEGSRTETWDPAAVRRCLDTALAAGAGPEERGRVAAGYLHWLADAARAAEVAPPGRAPEQEVERQRRLDGWTGDDPRRLLHRLRERITPQAIDDLAKADYGMAWSKHHHALLDIQSTGLLPVPLDWHPLEVLELTRWRRGAQVDHVQRGFAATVLLFDAVQPATHQAGHIGDSLAPALESVWALELADEFEPLLVWLAEVVSDRHLAWPLLALALNRARHAADDPRLPALVATLEAAEAAGDDVHVDAGWLFRTTHFDSQHDLWRALAAEILGAERPLPPELDRLARHLRARSGPP